MFIIHLTIIFNQIDKADDICGPWIQPSGSVFTHTASLASRMQEWETEVVLNSAGQLNYIIAHIKIGTIQMALGMKMHVHTKASKRLYYILQIACLPKASKR